MAYNKQVWIPGNTIRATDLNNIEAGIFQVSKELDEVKLEVSTGIANETTRQTNELNRIVAESNRENAESTRQIVFDTNETNRTNTFTVNESARNTAESNRVTVENARVTNELNRVNAENGRVSAENGRVSTYNSIIKTVSTCQSVAAVSNTYTLDFNQALNFSIETLDTIAKTIAFSNIPSNPNIILSITVKLKFTNNASITFPTVIWQNATIPTFTTGKQYLLMFNSYDNGATWLASFVGAW